MELAGGLFGGLLGLRLAVLDLSEEDVLLFLLGLGEIVAVLVEVSLVEGEHSAAKRAGLEVDEPLGIEGVALVPGLEMQVRAGGPAGRAAEADDVAGADPGAHLDLSLGQVAVGGLKAVLVADDDEVAVAAGILRDPDLAGKGGADRVSCLERQVAALVAAPVAHSELGEDLDLVRTAEVGGMVDQPQRDLVGEGTERHSVGIHSVGVPVLGEIVLRLELVAVLDVFPGIVAVEDELDQGIGGVERIYRPGIAGDHRLDGLKQRAGDNELRLRFGEFRTLDRIWIRLCI